MEICGGHVSTANKRTYPVMATRSLLATYGGVSYWSSVQDLFSDVLSTRPGQYVFFNVTKNDPLRNRDLDVKSSRLEPKNFLSFCDGTDERGKYGYTGIFKITGKPRFNPTELSSLNDEDSNEILEANYAIRVPIEPVKIYPDVFPEWRLLDVQDVNSDVWQPRFRKFLQGAKSLTSMTPWETENLIKMLDENISYSIDGEEISTDPDKEGKLISMNDILDQGPNGRDGTVPDGGLSSIELEDIVVKEGNKFKYEKGLEAWWVENFDKDFQAFDDIRTGGELVWFSNYIPATSSGSALDGLAILKKDNDKYRAIPVEMKRGEVKEKPGRREVEQLYRYSVWAREFLSNKVETEVEDVRPVYLAHGMKDGAKKKAPRLLNKESYFVDPTFIEYSLKDGEVQLDKRLIEDK